MASKAIETVVVAAAIAIISTVVEAAPAAEAFVLDHGVALGPQPPHILLRLAPPCRLLFTELWLQRDDHDVEEVLANPASAMRVGLLRDLGPVQGPRLREVWVGEEPGRWHPCLDEGCRFPCPALR